MSGLSDRADALAAALMLAGVPRDAPTVVAVVCNCCGDALLAPDPGYLALRAAEAGWKVGHELGEPDLCRRCR